MEEMKEYRNRVDGNSPIEPLQLYRACYDHDAFSEEGLWEEANML